MLNWIKRLFSSNEGKIETRCIQSKVEEVVISTEISDREKVATFKFMIESLIDGGKLKNYKCVSTFFRKKF